MDFSKKANSLATMDGIGFIGLGQMGGKMVEHLISHGVKVFVHDKNKSLKDYYQKLGASFEENPEKLVKKIDKLFLCLPFKPQIDEVLFGVNGVIHSAKKDLLIIDMSTICYSDAQALKERLSLSNIRYCDSPISGLPIRAQNGTLTIMFGGSECEYQEVLPFLNLLGEFVIHCGECGFGQMMKAYNNIVYNINIAAISEIFPLAVKSGLRPEALEKLFVSGSSRSFASEYFIPKMMKREFSDDYLMEDAFKDIENVREATSNIDGDKPLLNAMIKTYLDALEMGFGKSSKSAMLKVYEKRYNVKIS